MIKFNAVKCPNCQDLIYSVAQHDFHYCTCGKTMIDGNSKIDNKYYRIGGEDLGKLEMQVIEVDATPKELYDDWNLSINTPRKFGTIKG